MKRMIMIICACLVISPCFAGDKDPWNTNLERDIEESLWGDDDKHIAHIRKSFPSMWALEHKDRDLSDIHSMHDKWTYAPATVMDWYGFRTLPQNTYATPVSLPRVILMEKDFITDLKIEWGASFEEMKDQMTNVTNGTSSDIRDRFVQCTRINDAKTFIGLPIKPIVYRFYLDKLYQYVIEFELTDSPAYIMSLLYRYGNSAADQKEGVWLGTNYLVRSEVKYGKFRLVVEQPNLLFLKEERITQDVLDANPDCISTKSVIWPCNMVHKSGPFDKEGLAALARKDLEKRRSMSEAFLKEFNYANLDAITSYHGIPFGMDEKTAVRKYNLKFLGTAHLHVEVRAWRYWKLSDYMRKPGIKHHYLYSGFGRETVIEFLDGKLSSVFDQYPIEQGAQILASMHRLYGEGHAITGSTSSRFSSSTVNQNCFKWHPFLGRASVGYGESGNRAIVQMNWMVEGAPPQ